MSVEEGSGEGDVSLTLLSPSNPSTPETKSTSMFLIYQFFHQVLADVVSYISEYGLLQYISSDIQIQIEHFHQLINANDVVIVTKNGPFFLSS
jgi:hypothetical protein